jgi:membrane protease YdiL (CAAX protease family)
VANNSPSTTSASWPTHWPDRSFPPVPTALAGFIIALPFLAEVVLASRGGSSMPAGPLPPAAVDATLILTLLVEGAIAILALIATVRLSALSLRDLGFRAPSFGTIGLALVGAVAMALVANGSASLIDAFTHADHQQQVVQIFRALHDRTTVVIFVLFATVFAPMAEETIFRVFFFNIGLRYGGFWSGAVLSGALFGCAHGDLYAAVPLALGGMVLCGLYYRARNAFASMIAHGLFNGFTIAALLLAPQLTR